MRELDESDAAAVASWFESDPLLAERIFVAPPSPPVVAYAIERHGEVIGSVALHSASPDGKEIEVGVVMAPGAPKGPGVEGVRKACQIAFDSGVQRVLAKCLRSNEQAWRMAQRAGFEPQAWTDETVWLAMSRDVFDKRWRR